MTLTELIFRLQHLATLVDDPSEITVCVWSDFHEEYSPIKLVDFDDLRDIESLDIVI